VDSDWPTRLCPTYFHTLIIGSSDDTNRDLARLWELDTAMDVTAPISTEDAMISHFLDTHSVDQVGRYIVQLPRVPNPPKLGQSRTLAMQHFLSNERSLERKGKLKDFNHALQKYLTLGHAEIVPEHPHSHRTTTISLSMKFLKIPPIRWSGRCLTPPLGHRLASH